MKTNAHMCTIASSGIFFCITFSNEWFVVGLTAMKLWLAKITLEVSKSRQPYRHVFSTVERQLDKWTGMHALPSSVSVVSSSSHEELWLIALGHRDSLDITISVTLSLSRLHPVSFPWYFLTWPQVMQLSGPLATHFIQRSHSLTCISNS